MRIRTFFAAALALGACLTATGAAHAATAVELPRPTGPYAVGRSTFALTDPTRADLWVPAERRSLMVSLWYPARHPGTRPAAYETPQESALMVASLNAPGVPADFLAQVKTHSTVDAPPLGRPAPLVLLSPGFTLPRSTLTTLAEDLASRGYVVAGVDHDYEAAAITFPDGHTTTCLACAHEGKPALVANRAADLSFVLDRLLPDRRIDPHRVAVIGHSIGGAATLPAMLADRRLDAGVMLDGSYYSPPAPLARPYLLVGAATHGPGTDPSWDSTWPDLTGWRRWLTVDGADHTTFTDADYLFQQAGLPVSGIDPRRGLKLTGTYLAAFLDEHLRGCPSPLLEGASPAYPEVHFNHPGNS